MGRNIPSPRGLVLCSYGRFSPRECFHQPVELLREMFELVMRRDECPLRRGKQSVFIPSTVLRQEFPVQLDNHLASIVANLLSSKAEDALQHAEVCAAAFSCADHGITQSHQLPRQ